MCIQAVRMCTCTYACACVLVYVCAYEHTRAREHMYVHITMRNAFYYISLWLSPICDFNWLDTVHLNIYHFYTSDVFYTDAYYFTFVVPKMYQWQVGNDFNKDVYIYKNNEAAVMCICSNLSLVPWFKHRFGWFHMISKHFGLYIFALALILER